MAADVSSLVRGLNRMYNESSSTALITRDLLGDGGESEVVKNHINKNECQELDLDMQVPSGWEKRLDLKSGKVYFQKCNTPSPSSSSDHNQCQTNKTVPRLQDLNFLPSPSPSPSPSKHLINLFDETNLDLKLVSPSSQSSSSSSSNYQSVCTLDRVKSALERAKNKPYNKKLSLSPSYSSSSSSIKIDTEDEDQEMEENLLFGSVPIAPLPAMKKPRIDLNISI